MSNRYLHHILKAKAGQRSNLKTLARYFVINSAMIDARQGLLFGATNMSDFRPLPPDVAGAEMQMPPLAYGPLAGIRARPAEDWTSYCTRCFSAQFDQPFIQWLQASPWKTTEPSSVGAALRIAYAIIYGVPHDYREIAAAAVGTDYDANEFLWTILDVRPPNHTGGPVARLREWPPRVLR
jgi:hypothetical protein